ncbi:FAD-dependent monooxygenase [Streptomyces aureocirculatus]|uniref:FAD-dependent monooxygenase n=1 Tax=Streptomyces aureocirculatus TaxID=67275 RepID=UPI000ACB12EF|nr:FAD-dependent monooxygenase [Streptomyces aureocirculatus]
MPLLMGEVVVAGSSVGGLAAALAIARQRHRVTVLRERCSFVPPDAGVHLRPGDLWALGQLGVGLPVHGRAVSVRELRLLDGVTGKHLASVTAGSRHGRPHAVIPDRDLRDLLRKACGDDPLICIRDDVSVVHYEQSGERLTVFLSSGERHTSDALIGADGVCSPVRLRLTGGTARLSPHATFHTAVALDSLPEPLLGRLSAPSAVTLWAGPDWQLVHYPAGGDRLGIVVTCAHDARSPVHGARTPAARILDRLPGLAGPAAELLAHGSDWRMWLWCDQERVTRWHEGRVALTGAAVRPAFQYSLPAAFVAVDDAILLGNAMDCDAADFPQAFRSYADNRGRGGHAPGT